MHLSQHFSFFDHHATTPVDERVLEAMFPYFSEQCANASSAQHAFGRKVAEKVVKARQAIGEHIGAVQAEKEIIFTSGATESNHLALEGLFKKLGKEQNHIISQPTEHSSVVEVLKRLERKGAQVTWLDVDSEGRVDPQQIESRITKQTLVVSVMGVNHEIGTVQPIEQIGEITQKHGVFFHCDATQAVGKTPFNVQNANIDLTSFSAHKVYGPKGIGALFVRNGVRLEPTFVGGGQEQGLRSGTLNVPAIMGFEAALKILDWKTEAEHTQHLCSRLWSCLKNNIAEIELNGPKDVNDFNSAENRSPSRHPGNLSVTFKYIDGPALLLELGKKFAVSSGSACASDQTEPSPVLLAIGRNKEEAKATVRIGIGRFNTNEQVDELADEMTKIVSKLRDKSPLWRRLKK